MPQNEFNTIPLVIFKSSKLCAPYTPVLQAFLSFIFFFPPRIYIYSGYNYFSHDLVFRTLFLWLLASRYTWICQGHSKNGILGGKQSPPDLLWVSTPISLSVPLRDLSVLSTFPTELWTFILLSCQTSKKYTLKCQNPGDNMVQDNWVLIFWYSQVPEQILVTSKQWITMIDQAIHLFNKSRLSLNLVS